MFLEYGKGEGSATPAKAAAQNGFEITPKMVQAFGNPCRQSSLHPRIRRSVEEFQSTEAYKNWRSKLAQKVKDGRS